MQSSDESSRLNKRETVVDGVDGVEVFEKDGKFKPFGKCIVALKFNIEIIIFSFRFNQKKDITPKWRP